VSNPPGILLSVERPCKRLGHIDVAFSGVEDGDLDLDGIAGIDAGGGDVLRAAPLQRADETGEISL
jgi:hypothetical protein